MPGIAGGRPGLRRLLVSYFFQACCGSTELPRVFRTALHQGIAQRVPDELDAPRATVTDVERRQIRRKPVLGGLINEYTHAA